MSNKRLQKDIYKFREFVSKQNYDLEMTSCTMEELDLLDRVEKYLLKLLTLEEN